VQPLDVVPTLDAFLTSADAGEAPQVVSARRIGDLETPVSAFLKLTGTTPDASPARQTAPNTFLLESVEGGAVRGRYSIIGLAPDRIWRASGSTATLTHIEPQLPTPGEATTSQTVESVAPPQATLEGLRELLAASRLVLPAGLPPMAAGVFGYLGYDTIRLVERLPASNTDVLGLPDALFVRPTVMVIFDAVTDEIHLVAPLYGPRGDLEAYEAGVRRLEQVAALLDAPLPAATAGAPASAQVAATQTSSAQTSPSQTTLTPQPTISGIEPTSNTPRDDFLTMVARAKEYIAAGDIFQVVLSQRFSTPFTLPPIALYRALRRTNPSPFLFFLNFGDHAIVGSSPEILVRVRNGEVTIRPIAGTRPRGATQEADAANAADLLADEKELAEHLMLLDLGRNDVGRVAEIGSVAITGSFFLEYYSHVMHIVSNVIGKLDAARHDVIDALMAGFPAGTVSGAPKIRAMEIIDELERDKRGPYAGCVGYFSADGEMDTCIVLRTAVVKDGVMHVQAGAGVVADSIPENEQAECENKAKALFAAAREAVRFSRRGMNS